MSGARTCLNFIHIPRTGGSSFRYAMRKGYCGYPGQPIFDLKIDRKYSVTLNGHGQKIVPNAIFFIRDPAERFASSFCSRFNQGGELYHGPWTKKEMRIFSYFRTPNQLAEALDSEDQKEQEAAMVAMGDIQHVQKHMTYWLGPPEKIADRLPKMFFVGRTRFLNDDFERFKKKLGLGDEYQLPTDSKNKSEIRTPDRTLSDRAVRNLKKWYADDYQLVDIIKDYFKFIKI